jgi:hypothetical protein
MGKRVNTRYESGFLVEAKIRRYDTCLEFISLSGISGVRVFSHAFRMTDVVFSGLCTHFVDINTLLCSCLINLINKFPPETRYSFHLSF